MYRRIWRILIPWSSFSRSAYLLTNESRIVQDCPAPFKMGFLWGCQPKATSYCSMRDVLPQHLITLNLKYSSTAKPLRTLAFAQLSAKALYRLGKPASLTELCSAISWIIGVDGVSRKSVQDALSHLLELGQVDKAKKRGWLLREGTKTEIENELTNASTQLKGVLNRHFPRGIEVRTLQNWFSEASAAVFGYYGQDWVASVCRQKKKPQYRFMTLSDHLSPAIKTHNLEEHSEQLIRGYLSFLESGDVADQQYLMGLGQSEPPRVSRRQF